jgi:phosphatidate phosphatase APP1
VEGDFDTFVPLTNTTGPGGKHLLPGNETTEIQSINVYTNGTQSGNATAYLVPPEGVTVVSDIDDILRVTKIYEPKEGLLNTFARPFTPWMNMPDIYANWSSALSDFHFHYLTTTPEEITRNYMDFIYKTYPLGSFDTRPLNFSDVSATLSIRKFLLDKIFETFPKRQFILVADTSNSDVMRDYPELYHEHPSQVLCILLRNTSSTDPGDKFPYDTSHFKDIPQNNYMFFNVPDDLNNLDIENGQCYNATVKQNVTFDTQGLPFGLSDDDSGVMGSPAPPAVSVILISLLVAVLGVNLM